MKTNASNFTSETIVGLRNKHNQKLGNQTSENENFSKLEAINQHIHYCAKKGKPHAHSRMSFIPGHVHSCRGENLTLRSLKFLHSVTASPQQALSPSASAEADLSY